MLALRPTFSESWYRVANLKVKLRASTQISRQYYRGERWYVVRDPAGNQFHRLSDAAYRFVGLLDGRRTIEEAWDLTGGQLADDAPTQPEVIQILSQLYSANLIDADISPDATVLLRRHKQLNKKKFQGRLMSALFPRIPIWDPDRFLVRYMPVIRPFLSKAGWILWFVVVIAALALLAPRWRELQTGASDLLAPSNWPLLWLTFVGIKFIHELGHAFACRRFGGECHEMGIMFLVFIPTPYVDASSAWSFPSKWQRMFVGAGGMIVEIFFAAIMAFVWVYTDHPIIDPLAYNAMLIASVSTVLFNANPLLRYDGYYMLSDYLEIPNLQKKSTEYALGLIKRHVFRVKQQQPLPPALQRVWLFIYAILSTIYRVFIGILIIVMVAFKVPVLGILMALGGIVTWLVVPVVKLLNYLFLDPELHRKRGRAVAFTAAVAMGVIVLVGLVRFEVHFRGVGILEPIEKQVLYMKTPGFVTEVLARDGQWMKQGEVILIARDEALETEFARLEQRLIAAKHRLNKSIASNQSQRRLDQIDIDVISSQIADVRRRLDDLTLRAPIDGQLVAPQIDNLLGAYLSHEQEIGMVMPLDRLVARVTLDKRVEQHAFHQDEANGLRTEIRLAGMLDQELEGEGTTFISAAQSNIPHASLGHRGGGDVAVDPGDESGVRPMVGQFEARVLLSNPALTYFPGQRAYVRFTLEEKQPLLQQWGRRFWQLIQTHSHSRWM